MHADLFSGLNSNLLKQQFSINIEICARLAETLLIGGELHIFRILRIEDAGQEKYYKNTTNSLRSIRQYSLIRSLTGPPCFSLQLLLSASGKKNLPTFRIYTLPLFVS